MIIVRCIVMEFDNLRFIKWFLEVRNQEYQGVGGGLK